MLRRVALASCIAVAMGGCAIHPLPEDVTGLNTLTIVKKIRCEARDAIRRRAVAYLKHEVEHPSEAKADWDLDKAAAKDFEAKPELFTKIENDNRFSKDARKFFDKYDGAALGLEFSFDIKESTTLGGTVGLGRIFTGGRDRIGLDVGNDRIRGNVRSFTTTNTFLELVKIDEDYCNKPGAGENLVYPIAGRVGLDEVITTFIDLNETSSLGARKEGKIVPSMADSLVFTTIFRGSVTPGVEVAPVGRAFELASASFTASASRQDIHRVTVGLLLPADPPAASRRARLQASQPKAAGRVMELGTAATMPQPQTQRARDKSRAEYGVLDVIEEQNYRNFLLNAQRPF